MKKKKQKPDVQHNSAQPAPARQKPPAAASAGGTLEPLLQAGSKEQFRQSLLQMQRTRGNRRTRALLPARPAPRDIIQRGEAPVHEDIEHQAAAGSSEQSVKEMYAGNWMRDFSQFNLPLPHNIAAHLPQDVSRPHGPQIGAAGAEDIITAVIRALAYLHFGVETTDTLVTSENIGRYTPEQHVDNPMGTTAADHLVRDTGTGRLRTGEESFKTETQYAGGVPVGQAASYDPDRDRELAGKAFPGLQVENPDLYKVSDAGLANHIYNAIEWVKTQLHQAVQAGPSPQGRMFLGSALHAVEDYFAHSNFIEVALNSEVERAAAAQAEGKKAAYSAGFLAQAEAQKTAAGDYVDPLYKGKTAGGRQGVTTGTAGSEDLKVSMGQIILPKLPALSRMIDKKIDEALNLVVESEGNTTWEAIQEELKTDEGGHATLEVVTALDRHIKVPIYDFWLTEGIELPFTDRYIPTGIPGTDRFVPTGYDTSSRTGGVVAGIRHYIRLYDRIMGYLEDLQTGIHIAVPLTMLLDLKKQFVKWFNDSLQKLSDAIKQRKNEFLLSLVSEITGIDLKEAKRRGIEDVVEHGGHAGVEHLRGGTSIEARLPEIVAEQEGKEYGDERLYAAYGIAGGAPTEALPPSHSEISKDHAPHFEGSLFEGVMSQMAAANPDYSVAEGSLFYRLHKELAIEADSHIIAKVQSVWDEQAQENRLDTLASNPRLDPEGVLEEARDQHLLEQERGEKEGRTVRSYSEEGGEVTDIMALVDLFIAHPDDTTWWHSIVRNYVNAHEAQVLKHIRQRNLTRSARHP